MHDALTNFIRLLSRWNCFTLFSCLIRFSGFTLVDFLFRSVTRLSFRVFICFRFITSSHSFPVDHRKIAKRSGLSSEERHLEGDVRVTGSAHNLIFYYSTNNIPTAPLVSTRLNNISIYQSSFQTTVQPISSFRESSDAFVFVNRFTALLLMAFFLEQYESDLHLLHECSAGLLNQLAAQAR